MGRIILNLAMSLDGFICDENGGFDWIVGHGDQHNDTSAKFDFSEFVSTIDVIVMGANAYLDCGIEQIPNYENKSFIVASSKKRTGPENVEFISENVCELVLRLKEKDNKNIWLFGGAVLTDAFIKRDIIDQYIVGIIPTILGSGRPLFIGGHSKINLHLDEFFVEDGITISLYSKRSHREKTE